MSVRDLLAVSSAALVGFFLGLLEALDRLPRSHTLRLGAVGLAIALLIALACDYRDPTPAPARMLTLLLRPALSAGVFALVFEGMRLFLKIGQLGGALAAWIYAGLLALILARLTPAKRR